jgi:signal transduction histidine kinase
MELTVKWYRMVKILRGLRIHVVLALVLAGVFLLSVFWEFYLEDLLVPYIYTNYHPEPLYERVEYIFVSVIVAAIALIIPGWMTIRSTRQRERAMLELGKSQTELERRVQERTAELENANRKLVSALERQRETEGALRGSVQDLKQLSSRLLVLQEDEKKLIAAELHDSVSQTLSALKFRFEHILSLEKSDNAEMSVDIHSELLHSIQGAIDDVRSIYMELRPTLLDDFGLTATLNWLGVEFQKKYPHIHVAADIGADENTIPENLNIVIFRVVQEALNNVARHSRAKTARYSLLRNEDTLELVLQDDGIGFDLAETLSGDDPHKGTGLSSMRARVEQTMGRFRIKTEKDAGVLIRASWPGVSVQAV